MTLKEAIKQIDAVFGHEYTVANPNLVGMLLLSDALTEIDKTLVEIVESVVAGAGKVNLASFVSGLLK